VELSEVMRTTGAVREFTSDAVSPAVLYRVLDDARFATSGSNLQGWRVVVVEDVDTRRALRDLYRRGVREGFAYAQAGRRAFGLDEHGRWTGPLPGRDAVIDGADLDAIFTQTTVYQLAERVHEAPVLLVVCVELAALAVTDGNQPRASIAGGASIYPFAQNVLLAARNAGLGGVLTTALCAQEPGVRALLEVPDGYAVACLIVLGYPVRRVKRLARRPVEEFARVDRFTGPAFTGA
jgi:nitroreductase